MSSSASLKGELSALWRSLGTRFLTDMALSHEFLVGSFHSALPGVFAWSDMEAGPRQELCCFRSGIDWEQHKVDQPSFNNCFVCPLLACTDGLPCSRSHKVEGCLGNLRKDPRARPSCVAKHSWSRWHAVSHINFTAVVPRLLWPQISIHHLPFASRRESWRSQSLKRGPSGCGNPAWLKG